MGTSIEEFLTEQVRAARSNSKNGVNRLNTIRSIDACCVTTQTNQLVSLVFKDEGWGPLGKERALEVGDLGRKECIK
jgi:hypothetical protein